MAGTETGRMRAKTARQRLLNILQEEYGHPRRVAEAIAEEAESCLLGVAERMEAGQIRMVLAVYGASHAQAMEQTATTEVVWTVDGGVEDYAVKERHGRVALRRVRIQRLLDEALAQGAVATQEDLARALQVSVRTVKRDCAEMAAAGLYLPTRGNLQGIGRGQSHKAQIVGRWLEGATYDQISRQTHHSVESVRRYVQSFVQVMQLHNLSFPVAEIALMLQIGQVLVRDYLAIYQKHTTPLAHDRLQEQLKRLQQRTAGAKKGAV